MLQEAGGDFRFLFQAPGGEDVGVRDFSWGVFKPFYFDDALFRQFREDVVGFAQADAGLLGYGPLGEVGLARQEFEDFVADFLFKNFVHGRNTWLIGECLSSGFREKLFTTCCCGSKYSFYHEGLFTEGNKGNDYSIFLDRINRILRIFFVVCCTKIQAAESLVYAMLRR